MEVKAIFELRTPQMQRHFLHRPVAAWIVGKCIQMTVIIVRAIRFTSLNPALTAAEIGFPRKSGGEKGKLMAVLVMIALT